MAKQYFNPKEKVVSKYGSKRVVEDGINFHSIKERNFYLRLKLEQKEGELKFFLLQVPFLLPGGVRYLLDFLVVRVDGSIEYIDVKGFMTPISKLKIKQVEALYGIPIKIV